MPHIMLTIRTARKYSINNAMKQFFPEILLLFFPVVCICFVFFSLKNLNNISIPGRGLYFSFIHFLLLIPSVSTWSFLGLACQSLCGTSHCVYTKSSNNSVTASDFLLQLTNIDACSQDYPIHFSYSFA